MRLREHFEYQASCMDCPWVAVCEDISDLHEKIEEHLGEQAEGGGYKNYRHRAAVERIHVLSDRDHW